MKVITQRLKFFLILTISSLIISNLALQQNPADAKRKIQINIHLQYNKPYKKYNKIN
jgi:hypothetical protein